MTLPSSSTSSSYISLHASKSTLNTTYLLSNPPSVFTLLNVFILDNLSIYCSFKRLAFNISSFNLFLLFSILISFNFIKIFSLNLVINFSLYSSKSSFSSSPLAGGFFLFFFIKSSFFFFKSALYFAKSSSFKLLLVYKSKV